MNKLEKSVIEYFHPPGQYFWRWAENGEILEWKDGTTICYREDLMHLLKAQAPAGIPPLGTILLILTACKPDWKEHTGTFGILSGCARLLETAEESTDLMPFQSMIREALDFMDVVNGLPPELRTGNNRLQIIQGIFSCMENFIPEQQAKEIVMAFNSGELDEHVYPEAYRTVSEEDMKVFVKNIIPNLGEHLIADLENMQAALKAFPTSELLAEKVRTGVNFLAPEPEETLLPETNPQTLLELLAADYKTAGLARLTQRLISFLHIPLHTQGSSDLAFGGVSDISNRGNFDRLLLSELAHDDTTLMARLANNEALYLRKEDLPANLKKERILLLDTTLRMWGVPRIFGLAAALACSRPTKFVSGISTFGLQGKNVQPLNLETKEGVTTALEQLDPALHGANALMSYLKNLPKKGNRELILITEEWFAQSAELNAILSEQKTALSFLVVVNRQGQIKYFEVSGGKRKLLNTATLDLDHLLAATGRPLRYKQQLLKDAPAIMNAEPFPLYYPTSKVRLKAFNTYDTKTNGIISITQDHRILHWPSAETGAKEAASYIEKGEYHFGYPGKNELFLMARNGKKLLKLYTINLETSTTEITDFLLEAEGLQDIVYSKDHFLLQYGSEVRWLSPEVGAITKREPWINSFIMVSEGRKNTRQLEAGNIKKFINNGYSVLNKIRTMGVDSLGNLFLDSRTFRLQPGDMLFLEAMEIVAPNYLDRAESTQITYEGVQNPDLKFTRFTWPDGSEAIADSRGFLHFKSAQISIPEFSIVLIVNQPVAAWAADGGICGSSYFTGLESSYSLSPARFQQLYLERFTENIAKYGVKAKI